MAAMTRQSVRDFTRQEVEPIAAWVHRYDELAPDDLIAKMGELGFFAMSIPESYWHRHGDAGDGHHHRRTLTRLSWSRWHLITDRRSSRRPLDGGTEAAAVVTAYCVRRVMVAICD
jgi:alkylation response protein AidB-like acyl-CoA dehydrogenase